MGGAEPSPAGSEIRVDQLTGLPVPARDYTTEGDERLAAPLLAVRGIIV